MYVCMCTTTCIQVRVVYEKGELSVYIDHEEHPLMRTRVDLPAIASGTDSLSTIGFTAATGAASMDIDVLSFSFCEGSRCTPTSVAGGGS